MGPKRQGFRPRINSSQIKLPNFGSRSGDSSSRIGRHFSNKVVLKLNSAFYKQGAPKLIDFWQRIHFESPKLALTDELSPDGDLKSGNFIWLQLILGQKPCFLGPIQVLTKKVNIHYLILVAVSHTTESPTQLIVQLTYLYHQVLSVLTLNHISRIFEEKKGYDLRKMIAGSERLLDSLSNSMDQDPSSYILSAVRVLPIQSSLRESVSSVIKQHCSKAQNVVFALLIAENQLITLVRMKDYFIHPADLHLIFNLVSSSESFKLSESWTPICLPKFDSRYILSYSEVSNKHGIILFKKLHTCLILQPPRLLIFEKHAANTVFYVINIFLKIPTTCLIK